MIVSGGKTHTLYSDSDPYLLVITNEVVRVKATFSPGETHVRFVQPVYQPHNPHPPPSPLPFPLQLFFFLLQMYQTGFNCITAVAIRTRIYFCRHRCREG